MAGLFVIFFSEFAAVLSLGGLNNTAAKVGDQVTLACDLESNGTFMIWDHSSAHSNGKGLPFKKINVGPTIVDDFREFSLDELNWGQTLLLNSTETKHAGLYRCATKGISLNAHLIVLESDPICNLTFNQSHFDIRCEVLYNGSWTPTMQLLKMTTEDEKLNLAAENVCENNSTNNLAALTFTDSINNSLRFDDRYVFRMIFVRGSCERIKTNATNAPNYNFSRVFRTSELFGFTSSITPFTFSSGTNSNQKYPGTQGNNADSRMLNIVISLTVTLFALLVVLLLLKFIPKASRKQNKHSDEISPVNNESQQGIIDNRNTSENIGADGTVYALVNKQNATNTMQIAEAPTRPPMFSQSIYANIDHTATTSV